MAKKTKKKRWAKDWPKASRPKDVRTGGIDPISSPSPPPPEPEPAPETEAHTDVGDDDDEEIEPYSLQGPPTPRTAG